MTPTLRAERHRFRLRPSILRGALPPLSFALLLSVIFWLNPRTMSYFGLTLMLNLAIPVLLATLAQMLVIAISDLDLSIGPFVSLAACIAATWLNTAPLLGIAALLLAVLGYAALGALIAWRRLPSMVVTLGMSFVWLGLAILVLPTPGGVSPGWARAVMTYKPPHLPLPLLAAAIAGVALHVLLMRSSYGVVLRGAGGNARAVARAGWSVLRARAVLYGGAGVLGVLAGLALIGLTTSADANIADRYTLLSIAGVILGGGEFTGGRVSPIGAVFGALSLTLAGSLLTFLRIPPDWQVGAQGMILVVVLALRVLLDRGRAAS